MHAHFQEVASLLFICRHSFKAGIDFLSVGHYPQGSPAHGYQRRRPIGKPQHLLQFPVCKLQAPLFQHLMKIQPIKVSPAPVVSTGFSCTKALTRTIFSPQKAMLPAFPRDTKTREWQIRTKFPWLPPHGLPFP